MGEDLALVAPVAREGVGGPTLHQRIRQAKAVEKWSADDMWRLRLELHLA